MIIPPNSNWISSADIPPSIANGGTGYRLTTNDWTNALNWISNNTPENSVVAAWWDYGYWITTVGVLYDLVDGLRAVAVALSAYIPDTAAAILSALQAAARASTGRSSPTVSRATRTASKPLRHCFPRLELPAA